MKYKCLLTITGCNHYKKYEYFKDKKIAFIQKDKNNKYDKFAIKVTNINYETLGYIVNNPTYVKNDCCTNEDIYDLIKDKRYRVNIIEAEKSYVICTLNIDMED